MNSQYNYYPSTPPPMPRSGMTYETKRKKKGTNIIFRILFFCIAIYFVYMAGLWLLVGFWGNYARPHGISYTFNKYSDDGHENEHDWWVNYKYYVEEEDKTYDDFTSWKGTFDSPNGGAEKYYVTYLPGHPKLNIFRECRPVFKCHDTSDKLESAFFTVLAIAGYLILAALMLFLAGVIKITVRKKKRNYYN